ncbi:MAG: protein kinase domain-containing protein [Terriglobales bacterium]
MPLAAGTRIGPYEVVAPLGAGGMGEVYRAADTRLKREAALKCLPPAMVANSMAIERFRREAQLLAGLSHPNIAAVYGLETSAAGGAVLAMELVPGETLAERLRRGAMPAEEAIAVARQIAEALEYAHERGIIHRDLKPANIKITPGDQVKVLDFGLAKALGPELTAADVSDDSPTLTTPATLAGTLLGTAAYMAPEQARGKAVDRRADIWAFGAVLYEMLSGQRAFPGDNTTDVIAAVIRAEPDWARIPEATPPALRQLMQRCLHKDLRQRLQWMGDARIALEDIAKGEAAAEGAAAAPAAGRQGLRWAVPGFVAGLVVAALAAFFLIPRAAQSVPMRFRSLTSMSGVQRDPALSPDGRSLAFASNRDGSYNIYVGVIGGGNLVQITHGTATKADPAWTPDGTAIAYAQVNFSGLWDIWEVPALGGTPRLLMRDATHPAWSPDGRELAYVQPSTSTLYIGVPGQPARLLAHTSTGVSDPRFSPDGRRIAFIAGGRRGMGPYTPLDVVNVHSGALRQLTAPLAGMALSPVWTPGGRSIYFAASRGGTINIWKIASAGGTPQQITSGQGDDAELDLSTDGKRLAFATFRTDARIAELSLKPHPGAPAFRVLASDPARNQDAPEYSPDGKHLTYFSFLKGVEPEQVWISNADGSDAAPLVVNQSHNILPYWSQDGSHILFDSWGNGTTNLLALSEVSSSGGDPQVLLRMAHIFTSCAGPQGTVIYKGEHAMESLNAASGRNHALGSLPYPQIGPFPVLCAPDGGAIAYPVPARFDGDPEQGIWVYDFHHPARQVYRGWVGSKNLSGGPRGRIYFLTGSPDLKDELWAMNWNGTALQDLHVAVPAFYDYNGDMFFQDFLSMAPDGSAVAFDFDDALQANIGMLTFGK